MRPLIRVALCGAVLLGACHHKPKPVAAPAPVVAPPPPPTQRWDPVEEDARIYYDDAPAFTEAARLTIRDLDTWRSVWRRATEDQASAPRLPAVDFGRQMVLLVAAGRMHPGDEIRVDSVGTLVDRMTAVVTTTVACTPFPASAYPFEIVRVRRVAGEVRFVDRRGENQRCS